MAKQSKTVPVTMRALVQRINRKLAGDGKRLAATRGAKALEEFGAYYVISGRPGYIGVHKDHVDPEKMGHELGALKPWESLAD